MKESLPPKIIEKEPKLSKGKIEENLQRAKDTGRLLEQAYWEAVKEDSVQHHIEPKREAIESPIRSDEIFDPEEELSKIKEMPKEKRREKLREFKEKLAYQKEGLARTQEELIKTIRENPDITWPELYGKALDLLVKYGADTEGNQIKIDEILRGYYKKHWFIKKARERFPDDNNLFEAIFGRPPQGRIEVIEGPVTLYFRCHDIRDYALISQQTFLDYRDPTMTEIRATKREGGVSISTSLIPNLRGTIIAERARGEFTDNQKAIYIHEEQHAIKRLFDERPIKTMWKTTWPYEMDTSLTKQFRIIREQMAELRVKDEILAYMKEGRRDPEEIFKILTMSGQDGGLYDYLEDEKRELIALHSRNKSPDEQKMITETVKQVFETEYHKLIKDGIDAFQDLIDNGYTTAQTIALLNAEPLARWPKIVRRLTRKQSK